MTSLISRFIQCPYYHTDDKQQIICEGVERNTTIHLSFCSSNRCRDYKIEYCGDPNMNYRSCMLAKMLESKYEVKEDGTKTY